MDKDKLTQKLGMARRTRKIVEKRVQERTATLAETNEALQREIAARKRAEEELHQARAELELRVQQRTAALEAEITERERVEHEVVRDQAWLQSLIETTQDAVVSIDREGRIVLFNRSAERIFGYTKAEVQGQKVNLLMAEPYAHEHDGYIARYEQTGERHAIGRIRTVAARRKSGEIFPVELSVTEVATVETEEVHYAAFIRDISEKNRLHEQLVESERLAAVGMTAAKLAHEIANPLNGMYITTQLLERRVSKGAEREGESLLSDVRTLRQELTRLHQLLSNFASLSRREKYRFRPESIAAIVATALEAEMSHYLSLGIRIEQEFPEDLPLISIDSEKIQQVLLNLFKNAIEAMPQGGILAIRARRSGERIFLEIKDTGVGIPSEIDIFEPFATTKSSGTGLGLVIVRQILAAHGAAISYFSEEGKGTLFRLAFSLTSPAALS